MEIVTVEPSATAPDPDTLAEHPERTVESQRQWIEGIQIEGQRMQGLVEDMLALAKHDTAEVDAQATMGKQQEKLDVADMVQRAVLQFEAVAFERGVEIDVAENSSGPVFIGGVRGDIERVHAFSLTMRASTPKPMDTSSWARSAKASMPSSR